MYKFSHWSGCIHCAVVELKDSTLSKSTGMSGQEGLSVSVCVCVCVCQRKRQLAAGESQCELGRRGKSALSVCKCHLCECRVYSSGQ